MIIDRNPTCETTEAKHRQWNWMSLWVAGLAFLLSGTAVPAAPAGVRIEKPWMRFIIRERPAGGYFTLHNGTSKQLELTGASSSACGMVMLHQTKTIKGIEHMLPVRSVIVPAHGTVTFQPGGYHLMCMKPKDTMVVGHDVPVTLEFADGDAITARFPVKGVGNK